MHFSSVIHGHISYAYIPCNTPIPAQQPGVLTKRGMREREMVSMCLHLLPYSSNVINSVTHIASYMQSVGQRRDRRVAWHPIGGSHPVVWLSHLFPVTSYTLVCAWLPGLLTFVSHIPVYTAPLCSSAKQHDLL